MSETQPLYIEVEDEGARGDDAGGRSQRWKFVHVQPAFDDRFWQRDDVAFPLKQLFEWKPDDNSLAVIFQ